MVDFACPYEKLQSAAAAKVRKYANIETQIKQLTGAARCQMHGFVVSPRGAWGLNNDAVLLALRLPQRSLKKAMIENVIYKSLRTHNLFMQCH